ncbi:aldose reductase [Hyphopichia burtonii NRRL Y-1933]|uniref:2-dehydropantolactone reductase n=1 Tax=Hyphopichia burtonii NRRL Y-1933 TaxID=984485 RepID=A0A1E4RQC0_9ASCO|nr:aldose reductase [Hyphopichia burtonii NRRL Y-1933]ODV69470.1 aldose reductase [Hyphopichia burtonii NRRL Y-1933]
MQTFKLNNGATIPAIAYGAGTAWFKFGQDQIDTKLVDTLKLAIKKGFTHIDGAEIYGTSGEIGEAIQLVPRDQLFITSKYNTGDSLYTIRSAYENPYQSLVKELENKFKTPYVDLYLLHSPYIKKSFHGVSLVEAWQNLEKLVEDGYAKTIGVSNFKVEDIQEILDSNPKIKPAVNQIEFNAYLQEQTPGIVKYCQEHDILVEAYSPLGPLSKGKPGPIDDYVEKLSGKYHKAEEQILLKWTLQQGILPITLSTKEERIGKFLDIFDFELTNEEIKQISELGKQKTLRQYWTKEYGHYK